MKLAKKLKKTMGLMLISTMVLSAAPAMAADYDNHWAKEAITTWSNYGVVAGYEDGTFKPKNQVKRSELAAFIVRVFGLENIEGAAKFADVADGAWYAADVAKVSAAGIMQGASGKFNPNGYATREEVAVTLVNAFQLTGTSEMNFKDQAEIAAWAKQAVAALASNGYAKGQADNKFAPKANITRAEVVQLLDNIVEQFVHKAGTYTNNVTGNVVVNTKDAVLEGIKVNGNVYLAQGIGLGDATLTNTEVAGQVLVAGGGVNSIHFNKAVVKGGVIVNTKAPVRLVSKDSALSVTASANQSLVLTGSFKEVVVPSDVVLELKGATVEKLTVQASGNAVAAITIDKDSVVTTLVAGAATEIKGNGKITLLKAEANGVKTTITPGKTETAPGVTAPEVSKEDTKDESKDETNKGDNVVTPPVVTPPVVTPPTDNEKPALDYIAIDSVALNGNATLPSSVLSINGKDITLNLKGDTSSLPKTIETLTVKFNNLKEGEELKTVIDFSSLGSKELTTTVGANGTVTLDVSDLSAQFNAKKEAIIEKLNKLQLDATVKAFLEDMNISLDDVYFADGSVDVDKAIAKMNEITEYLNKNQGNPVLAGVVATIQSMLAQHNVTINQNDLSVTGKITLTSGNLSTAYTVTITR